MYNRLLMRQKFLLQAFLRLLPLQDPNKNFPPYVFPFLNNIFERFPFLSNISGKEKIFLYEQLSRNKIKTSSLKKRLNERSSILYIILFFILLLYYYYIIYIISLSFFRYTKFVFPIYLYQKNELLCSSIMFFVYRFSDILEFVHFSDIPNRNIKKETHLK